MDEAKTSRMWDLRAVLLPLLLSVFTGPILAVLFAFVTFILSANVFYMAWMAIGGVYLLTLFAGFMGWVIGGCFPTILTVLLATHDRLKHWSAAFLLVNLYGAVLYSLGRYIISINREWIAGALYRLLMPFFK